IILMNGDSVIDRLPVETRLIDKIAPDRDKVFRNRILLVDGSELRLNVTVLDRDKKPLVGVGALQYTLTGGLTEAQVSLGGIIADLLLTGLAGSNVESFTMDAKGLGSGSIHIAAAGGAFLDIPVEVVDSSVITRLEMAPKQEVLIGWSSSIE